MQIPINPGPVNQNIDVLRNELITYKNDKSGKMEESTLPEKYQKKLKNYMKA